MFVDNYGDEFETKEEVKAYAIQNLYENDGDFVNALEYFVTCAELLDWINTNPTVLKEFKKDYDTVLRIAEKDYAETYLHNCKEIKIKG